MIHFIYIAIIISLILAVISAKTPEKGYQRLTFDIDEATVVKMNKLMRAAELKSKGQLIAYSLTVYDYCVRRVGLGDELILRKPDGTEIEVALVEYE